jgi:hypothetical protein
MTQSVELHTFKNLGFLTHKFSEDLLKPIKEEVCKIKEDFNNPNNEAFNYKLAGNIAHEYKLKTSVQHLEEIIKPLIGIYDQQFDFISTQNQLTQNAPIVLDDAWVNFQKKHEFNPNHSHRGIISFVIWLEIPYYIEDELKNSSGNASNYNSTANFEMSYTDILGKIRTFLIPVDKKIEGTICLFPASLVHCVYPFYTSDEYRISVSGNVCYRTNGYN